VTLSPDFVALSTSRYTRRRDLIDRLRDVVTAAQTHLRVRFCDRLGVRYVNRVTEQALLGRLAELFRTEVLGTTCEKVTISKANPLLVRLQLEGGDTIELLQQPGEPMRGPARTGPWRR
jgi:uncharacterized protein (TIGR04255 family)